jgi:restriction endonuclease S subunit
LTRFKEIGGGRFDPFHFQKSFAEINNAIKNSKYNVEKFNHIISDLKNGVEIRNYVENGGIRYLRVTDLGKNGLNNDNPRFVKTQEIPERIELNKNCILVSRSGSLGLVNTFESELSNTILSSHIFKIELKTELIYTNYLEAYLRSKVGQSEIFKNNNGGVIPEINQNALKSINIVLPPLKKQQEIAAHISKIRQQAKHLQVEATNILETAKQKIEQIILGK